MQNSLIKNESGRIKYPTILIRFLMSRYIFGDDNIISNKRIVMAKVYCRTLLHTE